MKYLIIDDSPVFCALIGIISAIVGWITLWNGVAGIAHFVGMVLSPNFQTSFWEYIPVFILFISLCFIGLLTFWVTACAFRALFIGLFTKHHKHEV